jgi:hypothetical protein
MLACVGAHFGKKLVASRRERIAAMTRKPRCWQWTKAACYHLMNCGHDRETVVGDDAARLYLVDVLAANPWYEELSPEPSRRRALWREF